MSSTTPTEPAMTPAAAPEMTEEQRAQAELYPRRHTILSPGIKRVFGEQYYPREPSYSCFTVNQANEDATANVGDSFLVRKNEYTHRRSLIRRTAKEAWLKHTWERGTYENINFVIEYGITRVDHPSRWRWDSICYLEGEESPYPFLHSRWVPYTSPF
jgi:hypothetical protein